MKKNNWILMFLLVILASPTTHAWTSSSWHWDDGNQVSLSCPDIEKEADDRRYISELRYYHADAAKECLANEKDRELYKKMSQDISLHHRQHRNGIGQSYAGYESMRFLRLTWEHGETTSCEQEQNGMVCTYVDRRGRTVKTDPFKSLNTNLVNRYPELDKYVHTPQEKLQKTASSSGSVAAAGTQNSKASDEATKNKPSQLTPLQRFMKKLVDGDGIQRPILAREAFPDANRLRSTRAQSPAANSSSSAQSARDRSVSIPEGAHGNSQVQRRTPASSAGVQ